MKAAPKRTPAAIADVSPRLNSAGVLVLTGLSYLFVGLGFSYLDRRHGHFGLECTLWLVWALIGFGAGALHVRKAPGTGGQVQWVVLGTVGALLAAFPGFLMFNLLRWVCLSIMLVIGARAAVLRTRRDFYFTLMVIFVVSFMVGTHGNADWTLWIYLGPAWALGALALAWDHAAATKISNGTKLLMTVSFLGASLLLAVVLFLFLPRPATLGFGFMPPGTDTPGLFTLPGGGGNQDGKSDLDNTEGHHREQGAGHASGVPQAGGGADRWRDMLNGMRSALKDASIPQWQRSTLNSILGAGEWVLGQPEKSPPQPSKVTAQDVVNWLTTLLLYVALLVLGYLIWRRRYRIGLGIALGLAWFLSSAYPLRSMQLSAMSLKWCLHVKGHRQRPGQSVREHWSTATGIAPLAQRWLGDAVAIYGAVRFGGIPATEHRALRMHESVQGACDIVLGQMPEPGI